MEAATITKIQEERGWSKELLYQLVESVKDYAIFVSDLDGRIVSWNPGAEKIFGYSAKEAIGQNCRILFTEEDRAEKVSEKERATAREEGCAEDERWHVRKDGSYFFASGVQTPLYDESGKHTGYAKIARDLTERIKFEEQLSEAKDNLKTELKERTNELVDKNESLQLEVVDRKRSEELRRVLLRKIIRTQEDERKRIARDIHDHIGQELIALRLKLQLLHTDYKEDSKLNNRIAEIDAIAQRVDSEVDFLVWELRPSVLDDFGVAKAIEKFTNEWSAHFQIPAEFGQIGIDGKNLLPEIEINLYRLSQEALNNIAKHAKASNVAVLLERQDGKINLIIEDNGVGFDPTEKAVLTGDDRGVGLIGMKERAELVGGVFEIESSPGNGTTIYARVPAHFTDEEKG
jgi:PAS domain S-box-containing protein